MADIGIYRGEGNSPFSVINTLSIIDAMIAFYAKHRNTTYRADNQEYGECDFLDHMTAPNMVHALELQKHDTAEKAIRSLKIVAQRRFHPDKLAKDDNDTKFVATERFQLLYPFIEQIEITMAENAPLKKLCNSLAVYGNP